MNRAYQNVGIFPQVFASFYNPSDTNTDKKLNTNDVITLCLGREGNWVWQHSGEG